MTQQVQAALQHVNSLFPKVTQVFYGADGHWLFCDDAFNAPDFNGKVDVGLLEDAASSVTELPVAFRLKTLTVAPNRKESIEVQVVDPVSDQEWASDPDMLVITVPAELIDKAETCVAFMKAHGVANMLVSYALSDTLYALTECFNDEDLATKTRVTGTDGKGYAEFEPDYQLDGCHARIERDGDITAVLPFKHQGGSLRGKIGNIAELKKLLEL